MNTNTSSVNVQDVVIQMPSIGRSTLTQARTSRPQYARASTTLQTSSSSSTTPTPISPKSSESPNLPIPTSPKPALPPVVQEVKLEPTKVMDSQSTSSSSSTVSSSFLESKHQVPCCKSCCTWGRFWTACSLSMCLTSLLVLFPIATSVDISNPWQDWDMYRDALLAQQSMTVYSNLVSNNSIDQVQHIYWWPHNESEPNVPICNRSIPILYRSNPQVWNQHIEPWIPRSPETKCEWRRYPNPSPSSTSTRCLPCWYECMGCSTLSCADQVYQLGCGTGLQPFECTQPIPGAQCIASTRNTTLCQCQTVQQMQMDLVSARQFLSIDAVIYGVIDRLRLNKRVSAVEQMSYTLSAWIRWDDTTWSDVGSFHVLRPPYNASIQSSQWEDWKPIYQSPIVDVSDMETLEQWFGTSTLSDRAGRYLDVWIRTEWDFTVTGIQCSDPYDRQRRAILISAILILLMGCINLCLQYASRLRSWICSCPTK